MNIYILDLDDTLYSVKQMHPSTARPLLDALLNINKIAKHYCKKEIKDIYKDCWRLPFDALQEKYKFPEVYTDTLRSAYEKLEVSHDLALFEHANKIFSLPGDKYLVTTGFEKLQRSKIKQLGIEREFSDIYIDVPYYAPVMGKRYYFKTIRDKYTIPAENFIVIGDNINSEIAYAIELGMTSVLFDPEKTFDSSNNIYPDHIIHDFSTIHLLQCIPDIGINSSAIKKP